MSQGLQPQKLGRDVDTTHVGWHADPSQRLQEQVNSG
jgi:hypothetical protein